MGAVSIAKTIAKWLDKGYPEEVAERIARGELPMDEASRAARAEEMGMGPVLYRGHSKLVPPTSDADMFMSDARAVADTYANAIPGGRGATTPLRHNANNLYRLDADWMDYREVELPDEVFDELDLAGSRMEFEDPFGSENIAEAIKADGTHQGTLFENMVDDFDVTPDTTEASAVYNIIGSRPDVNIRHADAAFDPQYNGPNIMGNATVPFLGLLSSGSAGMGVLLNSLFAEAEETNQ